MNCTSFHTQLELWLRGETTDTSWKSHTEDCHSCRAAYQAIMGEPEAHVQINPDALTQSILKKTSLQPCKDIVLKDRELLGPFEKKVQDYHAYQCSYCRKVLAANEQLKQDLPLLAEQHVPPSVTQAILAFFKPNPVHMFMKKLWGRPRFSLEFSYVTALLFWLAIHFFPVNLVEDLEAQPKVQALASSVAQKTEQQYQHTLDSLRNMLADQRGKYAGLMERAGSKSQSLRDKTRQMFQMKLPEQNHPDQKENHHDRINRNPKSPSRDHTPTNGADRDAKQHS